MHPRTDPRASVPRCSFETLGIFAPLCLPLEFLGLSEPMESQVMAWPHIYAGEDVVLVSEAGSGKTMAYLLPLIQRVWEAEERGDKESGQVAVVVPTQDLAVQVLKQAQQLCDGGPLTCADAAGDARGSHVLVGTPSTMVQCLGRSFRDRPGELVLVLDEADMLLSGVKKTATSSDRPVRPSR
jgi:superfamily II DNA/RNA helicase